MDSKSKLNYLGTKNFGIHQFTFFIYISSIFVMLTKLNSRLAVSSCGLLGKLMTPSNILVFFITTFDCIEAFMICSPSVPGSSLLNNHFTVVRKGKNLPACLACQCQSRLCCHTASSFELMKTLSAVSTMGFSALRGHNPWQKENGSIPLSRACH